MSGKPNVLSLPSSEERLNAVSKTMPLTLSDSAKSNERNLQIIYITEKSEEMHT